MVLSPASQEALTRYSWPGNIRELENVIARTVVLSPGDVIEPDVLGLTPVEATSHAVAPAGLHYINLPYHQSMEEHSSYIIDMALEKAGGNQTKAAEVLGLQRTYLARLIKQRKPQAES